MKNSGCYGNVYFSTVLHKGILQKSSFLKLLNGIEENLIKMILMMDIFMPSRFVVGGHIIFAKIYRIT